MTHLRSSRFLPLALLFIASCALPPTLAAESPVATTRGATTVTAPRVLAPGAAHSDANNPTEYERRAAVADSAQKLLIDSAFEALETQASEYVRYQTATPAGKPLISLLHAGVDAALETLVTGEGRMSRFEPAHAQIDKWLAAYPESPTGHLAKARLLWREAWAIRGPRFADKVLEADREPYRLKIEEAAAYLDERPWIGQADPTWFEQRLHLALEQGMDDAEYWKIFQAGVVRDRDHSPLYQAVARKLYPRWGGSWEQIETFARAATEMTSAELGTSMYARIMWNALADHRNEPITRADWPTLRKSFEDLTQKRLSWWNLQNFAYFACEARDLETARRVMRSVSRPQRDAWREGWYQSCFTWINADKVAAQAASTQHFAALEQKRELHGMLLRLAIGVLIGIALIYGLLRWRRARESGRSAATDDAGATAARLPKLEDEAAALRRALDEKARS